MKMRFKFPAAIMMALSSAIVVRAAVDADTVAVIEKPMYVKIINNGNSSRIIVVGSGDDQNYKFDYKTEQTDSACCDEAETLFNFNAPFARKAKKTKNNSSSVDGFCDLYSGALVPAGAGAGFHSAGWEIGMLNLFRATYRMPSSGTEFSIGAGWAYRRLPVSDGCFISSSKGVLSVLPVGADMYNVRSHVRSFNITIPLTVYQRICGKFGLEIGVVANFNTYTIAKVSWNEDGASYKATYKGLHQRILTPEVLVRLGLRGKAAVYARYSPMSMFDSAYGPETDNVAIGLSIGF